MFEATDTILCAHIPKSKPKMKIHLSIRDVFHALSPVGSVVEAVSTALLLVAMAGCAVAALP